MKLSAPKRTSWFVAFVLLVLGLIGYLYTVPVLTATAFWFILASAVLLLLATALKGL